MPLNCISFSSGSFYSNVIILCNWQNEYINFQTFRLQVNPYFVLECDSHNLQYATKSKKGKTQS